MAYAATVTLHDAEGESIHTIRYGRMPKGDVRGLCRGLARDIMAMRAQRPELKVAYLTEVKRKAKPGQFRRWRHALKHDQGAAAQIVEQLEQSGLEKATLDGVRRSKRRSGTSARACRAWSTPVMQLRATSALVGGMFP